MHTYLDPPLFGATPKSMAKNVDYSYYILLQRVNQYVFIVEKSSQKKEIRTMIRITDLALMRESCCDQLFKYLPISHYTENSLSHRTDCGKG